MRSDLVHAAMTNVSSRYLLVNSASKATRLFHRPQTQVSETVNEVLSFFHDHDPLVVQPGQHEHERAAEVGIVPQFGMRS
jgi:hypothetical protein